MKYLTADFTGKEVSVIVNESKLPDVGADDLLIKVKACAVNIPEESKHHHVFAQSGKPRALGLCVSGEVISVGSSVEIFHNGMSVVGCLPIDGCFSGCSDVCILNQFDAREKPPSVSHEQAAAWIGPGLAAYTAIHYQGSVTAGDTVLIIDGATPRGLFMITLAQSWGAKVITTYKTITEKQILDNIKPTVAQLIDLSQRSNILASSVMEETGGVGVDCIIDNSVRMFTSEEDKDLMEERSLKSVPHKYEILSCLGFSGKWITSQSNLQLDPPDSQQLFLRGASVSFLFPPAWILMRSQQGRYQHILKDILDRLEDGVLKYNNIVTVSLDKAAETLSSGSLDTCKIYVVTPDHS